MSISVASIERNTEMRKELDRRYAENTIPSHIRHELDQAVATGPSVDSEIMAAEIAAQAAKDAKTNP